LPNDSETKLLTIKLEIFFFKLPNDDDEAKLVRKIRGKKEREKEKEGCQ